MGKTRKNEQRKSKIELEVKEDQIIIQYAIGSDS
jgi:hypothetical protein